MCLNGSVCLHVCMHNVNDKNTCESGTISSGASKNDQQTSAACVQNIYFYALQILAFNIEKILYIPQSFCVHVDVMYTFRTTLPLQAPYLWL